MAVTPKSQRGSPRAKRTSSTMSASEALMAAEAAIGDTAKVAPEPKKVPVRKPVVTVDVPEAVTPAAIVAATTAVDAAPEPEIEPAKLEPITTKSLSQEAEPVKSKTLSAIEGTKTMNDMMETGKKMAADAKAKIETVYADMNEKAKVSVEKSTKAIEELSDIAKGNVEAIVESGKIAAKGMEAMGQEAADYGRKSLEKATASFKSFSTVKTPTEFFQLQSQLLSSSFDEFTKEAAKSSEAFIKLAGDVASPLTARVTVVTDKVKSLAA